MNFWKWIIKFYYYYINYIIINILENIRIFENNIFEKLIIN